ncbi:TPA: hypothetical protein EYP66_14480 [Candidatus Poribacteria bacterium]|nr:hypothetical protein [Candidatus Poribacteria bacterium]
MSKIKAYLQLIRFPAVFTALADIFAGYLTAFGAEIVSSDLLLLLFASSQVYWAGMVFNDYFDYYTDLRERPKRPLPSGAISRNSALCLGIAFSLLSITAAGIVGLNSLLIAIILVIVVILYDWLTKGIPAISVFNMGLCRGLNIALGMSIAEKALIFHKLPVALILMAYIIFVTQLSKGEVEGSNRIRVIITIAGVSVLTVILNGLSLFNFFENKISTLILSVVFLLFVMPSLVRAAKKPVAQNISGAVKNCLLGIIILDGCFIAGAVGIIFAILIALSLLIPAILTSRLMYIT